MTAQASNPSEQPAEQNYTTQDEAFASALYQFISFAEESYPEKEIGAVHFLAYRALSYLTFSIGAPAVQIRDLINQAINKGYEDSRTIEEGEEYEDE